MNAYKTLKKRCWCILLICALAVSLFPTNVLAGEGTLKWSKLSAEAVGFSGYTIAGAV